MTAKRYLEKIARQRRSSSSTPIALSVSIFLSGIRSRIGKLLQCATQHIFPQQMNEWIRRPVAVVTGGVRRLAGKAILRVKAGQLHHSLQASFQQQLLGVVEEP